MGCLRLTYNEQQSPLRVVHRKSDPAQKVIQRFISVDPLADDPRNVSWSPYTYTWNNPLKFTDPTGMIGTNGYEEQEDGSWKQVNTIGGDNHHTYQYRNGDVMYLDKTSKGWVNSFVSAKERNADVASRNNTSGVALSMTNGRGNETKRADDYSYQNIDDVMIGGENLVRQYNVGDGNMINAEGHFSEDRVTPNVLLPRYDNPGADDRKQIGFMKASVSQKYDSISWFDFDLDTNVIDTNSSRAITPKKIMQRRTYHPSLERFSGVVKNPRQ